jgi:hypothetical protein
MLETLITDLVINKLEKEMDKAASETKILEKELKVLPANYHMKSRKNKSGKITSMNPKAPPSFRVRITVANQTVTTTAGGIVALQSFSSDSLRSAGTEFASYAARWTHWRCHSMTGRFDPVFPSTISTTVLGHGQLYMASYWGTDSTLPSTAADVLSIPGSTIHSTSKRITHSVKFGGYLDAHLWCPVNAAQPNDQILRIYFASNTLSPLPLTAVVYTWCLTSDCEFMGVI